MCRSIKTLFNTEKSVTDLEIKEAAVQFVRKLSGFRKPSQINAVAFDKAVEEIAQASQQLLTSLVTTAPPRKPKKQNHRAYK